MNRQTTLPIEYSIHNLKDVLAKKKPLPPAIKGILTKAASEMTVPQPNEQSAWNNALSLIEIAWKGGQKDCALGLLCSKEFQRILISSQSSPKFRKEFHSLLGKYPNLKLNYQRSLELSEAISARSSKNAATALDAIRKALENAAVIESKLRLSVTNQLMELGIAYLPEHDASHEWDWTENAWFLSRMLESPWLGTSNMGVDITLDKCLPEDGWELYIRRILNSDGLPLPLAAGFEEQVMPNQKYFALYNIRSGLLRVFLYAHVPDTYTDQLIALSSCCEGAESNLIDNHGVFNNIGPICYSLEESASVEENQIRFISTWSEAGWLVLDFPLSYDASMRQRQPFSLYIKVKAANHAQIKLEGKFTTKVPVANPEPSMFEKIGSIFGVLMGFSDSAKDVDATGNKIKNFGQKITTEGGDGAGLMALGNTILSLTNPLAAIISGTQLIRTFMSLGDKSGGVKYAYHEQSVNLTGDYYDEGDVTNANILLNPQIHTVNPIEIPYFYKQHYNTHSLSPPIHYHLTSYDKEAIGWNYRYGLGTFNLTRLPQVRVDIFRGIPAGGNFRYFVKVDVEATELKSLVALNPSWPVTLDEVQLQIVLQKVSWGYLPAGGGEHYQAWEIAPEADYEVYLEQQKYWNQDPIDPQDRKVVDVFHKGFHHPSFYSKRLFLAKVHYVSGGPAGKTNEEIRSIRIFLRLHVKAHFNDIPTLSPLEWVNTYKCNPEIHVKSGVEWDEFPVDGIPIG